MLTSLTIQYMRSMMRMRERTKVRRRQQWPSKLNPWLFLKIIVILMLMLTMITKMVMIMIKNTCTAPLRCVCEVSSSGRASPPKGSVGEHHFDFKFLDEDDKDDHREW